MPCYYPLTAYRIVRDRSVVFKKPSQAYLPLQLPCGQCHGCRLERSRQWALRCVHEAQLHKHNCFLTLTYDEEHIPDDYSLKYEDFQLFMKRLRKHFKGVNIRFYMCGEYGDNTNRPHYHCCLFGLDFPDKILFKRSNTGHSLYRSATLERLWGLGHCSIGELNFETAAYTARYVMKKRTGFGSDKHYRIADPSTGEIYQRVPEFTKMSLKPGIGADWFSKFQSDVFPHDRVVSRGVPAKPPRYYDKLFDRVDSDGFERIRKKRVKSAFDNRDDNTPDRLEVKSIVARAKSSLLKRNSF